MAQANFYYPTNVKIGCGILKNIAHGHSLNIKECFIISGKNSMRRAGVLDELSSLAIKNNIGITFSKPVSTNPSNEEIDEIINDCNNCKADTVIGIGGGSSQDVAKIVAMVVKNGGKSWDYVNTKEQQAKKIHRGRS